MIRLKDLSYRYGQQAIFDQLNLELPENAITVIIGQNGSGKTTLARLLNGLEPRFRGEIWLDNLRLRRHTPLRELRQKIGLVMQNPEQQILLDTVYDEVAFGLKNLGLQGDAAMQSLQQVDLAQLSTKNPRELSGGQQQRLNLASMLAMQPRYLVLDEPTSMLDLSNRERIYRLLLKLKSQHGIILMTNNLDEILLANQVIILDRAHAYQLSQTEIIQHPEILEKYHLQIPLMLKLASKLNCHDYFGVYDEVERMQ